MKRLVIQHCIAGQSCSTRSVVIGPVSWLKSKELSLLLREKKEKKKDIPVHMENFMEMPPK